jgi:hypothetical protein
MLVDGSGSLSGSETFSANGTIVRNFAFTGSYSVNSDCSGSATLTPTDGSPSGTIDLVIAPNGTVVQFITTQTGFAIEGTAYQIGNPPQ